MNGWMALGIVSRRVVLTSAGARLSLAGVLLFAWLGVGCDRMSPFGPAAPTSTCDLKGYVWNDGAGYDQPYVMVGDATVTVIDGPNAGRSARTSDRAGFEMSDWKSGDALFEVRKDGYDPITERQAATCGAWGTSVLLRIGQPPHILRGSVRISGTHAIVDTATVEIVDGANAGHVVQTDSQGAFQFNDLQASAPFSIRVSKIGFRTATFAAERLAKNTTLSGIIELAPL
jgi:hypothetical protein